jgi:hypothetical protein
MAIVTGRVRMEALMDDGDRIDRRNFLRRGAQMGLGVAAAGLPSLGCGVSEVPPVASDGWNAGEVLHLLPSANHERIRIKASFRRSLEEAPALRIGSDTFAGVATDLERRCFTFDAKGLESKTRYGLGLESAAGDPLCEDWPLSTLPAPDDEPEHLRVLVYTCAGGSDDLYNFSFFEAFLGIPTRRRLLERALTYSPDLVVANGDHVYWDLRGRLGPVFGSSWRAGWVAGHFDRERGVHVGSNERVLKAAFGSQIADLYGAAFRSVPTYFLQDDHDYGENDEATDELRTFPADAFMRGLAKRTQALYYPELLPTSGLPNEFLRRDGVCESFGSLRYGRLFEALLYDCRRELTNAADASTGDETSSFVSSRVEAWLRDRTLGSRARHVAHMPSTPMLWTAGKWGEWYPDGKDEAGQLAAGNDKPYWASGWNAQHDRILEAAVAREDRTPLFISGDLHAIASGRILASNGQSFESNPPVSILSGPISTAGLGFPSQFRGQVATPSGTLAAAESLAPIEENGFTILDITPREIIARFFRWHPDQGVAAIERLEAFHEERFARNV